MSLWDDLTSWIDPTVDWVAEAVGYTAEAADTVDAFGVTTPGDLMTAGDYLVDDIKDVVGFAKKGYKVYSEVSGLYDKKTGQRTDKPYFTQPSFRKQPRSVGDLTSGSRAYMRASPITGNPVNIGYANPDVRSYLTQLAQSSYNQQMNNMFSSYLVSPTRPSGQKTIGIGSTTVKGTSTKTKTKTARSQRGLG
tara:strand:- start:77 stop:655 length:579 start_codon:yes stop_codon:yes gene_type:complete